MKICKKCQKAKDEKEFTKNKATRDGLGTYCKACANEYKKKWSVRTGKKYKYKYDPEKARLKRQTPEAIAKQHAYYRTPEYRAKARARYYANREECLERSREYYQTHKAKARTLHRRWCQMNKEKVVAWHREWRHTPKGNACLKRQNEKKVSSGYAAEWKKRRRADGSIYHYRTRTRDCVNHGLRYGYTKKSKAYRLVGCDYETARKHLLGTWRKKYGYDWAGEPYQIDHIVPLATAKTEVGVDRLLKLENTRMVKPEDNLRKSFLTEND